MRAPCTLLLASLAASGCLAFNDTGEDDGCPSCTDPDGSGTDTGNIPDLGGYWTSTFGTQSYWDDCTGVGGISQTSETWLNGAAMHVGGYAPDGLQVTFGSNSNNVFQGMVNQNGGVIFAGRRQHTAGEMHVAVGGLVFHSGYLGRDVIEGYAYLGLDLTGDGEIECSARGQWQARKSG